MVLRFCPFCANLLRFRVDTPGPVSDRNRFACPTCPYIYQISKEGLRSRTYFMGKKLADILDSKSALLGQQATEERCPKCSHPRAYFEQRQTRSADEPMTLFYTCCSCSYKWRVD